MLCRVLGLPIVITKLSSKKTLHVLFRFRNVHPRIFCHRMMHLTLTWKQASILKDVLQLEHCKG